MGIGLELVSVTGCSRSQNPCFPVLEISDWAIRDYPIAPFIFGGSPNRAYRSLPAFGYPNHVRAVMKGYYGDWFEPALLTKVPNPHEYN